MLGRGRSRSPHPRLRGWLVVAALVGLFSMHGLAAHGTSTGHGASVEGTATAAVAASATSGHATPAVAPAADADAAHLEPLTLSSPHGMGVMEMTGMVGCLVVLLAAGLLLCAARAPGSLGVAHSAAFSAVVVGALHRLLPPPDLVRLGVCRC